MQTCQGCNEPLKLLDERALEKHQLRSKHCLRPLYLSRGLPGLLVRERAAIEVKIDVGRLRLGLVRWWSKTSQSEGREFESRRWQGLFNVEDNFATIAS